MYKFRSVLQRIHIRLQISYRISFVVPRSHPYNQQAIHWRVAQRCVARLATMLYRTRIRTRTTIWRHRIRRVAWVASARVRAQRVAQCMAQIRDRVPVPTYIASTMAAIRASWTWPAAMNHRIRVMVVAGQLVTRSLSAPTMTVCRFRYLCKFQLCHHRRQWICIRRRKLNPRMRQVRAIFI